MLDTFGDIMDDSFVFLTSLTQSVGKVKGVPNFAKLPVGKRKLFRLSSEKIRLIDTSTSSGSYKTAEDDSLPSLKSRSNSLDGSDDFYDENKKSQTQKTDISWLSGNSSLNSDQKADGTQNADISWLSGHSQSNKDRKNDRHQLFSSRYNNCIALTNSLLDDDEEPYPLDKAMGDLSIANDQQCRATSLDIDGISSILRDSTRQNKFDSTHRSTGCQKSSNNSNNSNSSTKKGQKNVSAESNIENISPIWGSGNDKNGYVHSSGSTTVPSKAKSKKETKKNKPRRKKRNEFIIYSAKVKENSDVSEDENSSADEFGTQKSTHSSAKKKDSSFIVDDDDWSVLDNSLSIYRQLISEDIKRLCTPLRRKKKIRLSTAADDGIFTPFLNRTGKQSELDEPSDVRRAIAISDSDEDWVQPKPKTGKIRRTPIISTSESDEVEEKENDEPELSNDVGKANDKKAKKVEKNVEDKTKKFPTSQKDGVTVPTPKRTPNIKPIETINLLTPVAKPRPATKVRKKSRKSSPVLQLLLRGMERTLVTNTPPAPSNSKTPLTFLHSLSAYTSPGAVVHPEALTYKNKFKKLREELTRKLFTLFNAEVFDNKLPSDMEIVWNGRMRSTSGTCNNRRDRSVILENHECLRISRIQLSTKINETPDRLRDTLIHELCHAAAWIIDNKSDGHGPIWKAWTAKARQRFPELPPISTCHAYAIKTKYKYVCTVCGYTIGRHSRRFDVERKRCGYCYGKFQLKLYTTDGLISPKDAKSKPATKFSLFVKEHYAVVKKKNPNTPHGEIMKLLSTMYAATKNAETNEVDGL